MIDRGEVAGLCSDLELAGEKCDLLYESVRELCERKPKRKLSNYQIFVGDCIKRERKKDEVVTAVMKRCVLKWREKRDKEKH